MKITDEMLEAALASFVSNANADWTTRLGLIEALKAIAPLIIEECAKAVDHSLCDVMEDTELFGAHCDFFAAAIRALKED